MATVTLKGNPINTHGELPAVGAPTAPDFKLVAADLKDLTWPISPAGKSC